MPAKGRLWASDDEDDEDDDDDDDVNDEDCVDAIIGANIVLLLAIYPLDAAANLARDQVHFNSKWEEYDTKSKLCLGIVKSFF